MIDSTKAFLSNPLKGSAVTGLNVVTISDIFRQYSSDFIDPDGTAGPGWFLQNYGPPSIQQAFSNGKTPQIEYYSYEWDLNGDVGLLCLYQRTCFPWWAFLCVTLGVLSLVTFFIILKKRLENRPDTSVLINFEE